MTPEEEARADSCKCEACAMRRAMEEQGRELDRVVKERDEARAWRIRMTDRASRVMGFAERESRRVGRHEVGDAALLLGILAERDGPAAEAIRAAGVDVARLRREVEQRVVEGPTT